MTLWDWLMFFYSVGGCFVALLVGLLPIWLAKRWEKQRKLPRRIAMPADEPLTTDALRRLLSGPGDGAMAEARFDAEGGLRVPSAWDAGEN